MKVRIEWFDQRRFNDTVVEVDVNESEWGLGAEMRQINNVVDKYGSRLLHGILPSVDRPVRFDGDQMYPCDPWLIMATCGRRQLGYRLVRATCNGIGEQIAVATRQMISVTIPLPEICSPVWELALSRGKGEKA